jgi:hypothetical protein
MTNPYGIVLDRRWAQWAAAEGVSETITAALQLIARDCAIDAIAARLAPPELERVIDIVRPCGEDTFPRGALAALEGYRQRALKPSRAMRAGAASSEPDARISLGAARMRKTRERRRKGLCLLRVEVPKSAVEAAKRGNLIGLTAALRDILAK